MILRSQLLVPENKTRVFRALPERPEKMRLTRSQNGNLEKRSYSTNVLGLKILSPMIFKF